VGGNAAPQGFPAVFDCLDFCFLYIICYLQLYSVGTFVYNLLSQFMRWGYKMNRDEQVNIRLSLSEYWQSHDACQFLDITISQVCRKSLRQAVAEAKSKGWIPDRPIEIQGVK
jgi:hypothetical protein